MAEPEMKITKPSEPKPPPLAIQDESQFANLLDTGKFEHLWRVASLFSKSNLVPESFRGKPEDCFIAIQMAIRLGVEPFMFLQKTYVVHGRPGMEAQLAIALINARGPFTGPIQWRFEGQGESRTCIAFATHKITGELCEAPVSWKMVVGEGWASKAGSKWQTMPDIMFRYRSATFLARLYAPECLMGLLTQDELQDLPDTKIITSEIIPAGETRTERLANKLAASKPAEVAPEPEPARPEPGTPTPEPPKRGPGRPPRTKLVDTHLPAPTGISTESANGEISGSEKMLAEFRDACLKLELGDAALASRRMKLNYGVMDPNELEGGQLIAAHTKAISDLLAFESQSGGGE